MGWSALGRAEQCGTAKGDNSRPPPHRAAMFRFYDVGGAGAIRIEDLRELLRMLLGDSLSAVALEEIAAQTLAAADVDGDGVISRADFAACMGAFPWHTIDVPVRSNARQLYFSTLASTKLQQ